jgi:simple sugar transport system substrate-binding protein
MANVKTQFLGSMTRARSSQRWQDVPRRRRGDAAAALIRGIRTLCLSLATAGAVASALLLSEMPSAKAEDQKPVRITYIIYSSPHVFWNPTLRAIEDAEKQLNVDVDVQYANGDPVTQNTTIESAITNHVDGIVLTPFSPGAFNENIKRARDAGIAVIAANIDDPSSARQAFVGAIPSSAGYAIGKRMIEACRLTKGDKVFTPVEQPEETEAADRLAGVQKALDEVGAVAEGVGTGGGFDEALRIMTQYLVGHQDTKCVISLGGTPTAIAADAIAEAGLDIPNGGFDLNDLIIDKIKAGKLVATIDQQPFMQGFLPVLQIAYYTRYGLSPFDVNTGLAIVDASNVELVSQHVGTYR